MNNRAVDTSLGAFYASFAWLLLIGKFGSSDLSTVAHTMLGVFIVGSLLIVTGAYIVSFVRGIYRRLRQRLAPQTFTITTEARRSL